jgi:hypothetical protein
MMNECQNCQDKKKTPDYGCNLECTNTNTIKDIVKTLLLALGCYTENQIDVFLTGFDWENLYNKRNESICLLDFTAKQCPLFGTINNEIKSATCSNCDRFKCYVGYSTGELFYYCQKWNKTFPAFNKLLQEALI